ncbi:MAG: nucleoside hydrolase [Spirochaetia bacterium]|jgi:inosine-uridine nucleoside N-ribohydrolase|nr:nucleoside hydrolase [Spirochaetia bacterium]
MNKIPVVIDVDLGFGSRNADIDDALVLLLALNNPFFDVKAITTVGGNVSPEEVALNLDVLLKRIGFASIPHSNCCGRPLDPLLWVKERWHGSLSQDCLKDKEKTYSVDLLRHTIHNSNEKITILASGPLTNLALALATEPSLSTKIKQICLMGGTKTAPGLDSFPVEFNIKADPYAAAFVFSLLIPTYVFSLDVTKERKIIPEDLDVLNEAVPDGLVCNLREAFIRYMSYRSHKYGFDKPFSFIHDAYPVVYLLHPEFFSMTPCHIAVDTDCGLTNAMTVFDTKVTEQDSCFQYFASHADAVSILDFVFSEIVRKWGNIL